MEYIGVDIAKANLQISNGRGSRKRLFPNSPQGIDQLLAWLESGLGLKEAHLIIEPTNTYHHSLVQALLE